MIKFFRKVRQQLLKEGKLGKYLAYALGEILLVVIGILIALNINNWNIAKKDADFEKKILFEIKTAIGKDLRLSERILEGRVNKKIQAIHELIAILHRDDVVADSILENYFWTINLTSSFMYDSGAYESLKSIGLDKIKNDSLRNALVRFYESSLPRSKHFMNLNKEFNVQKRDALRGELIRYEFVKVDSLWYSDPKLNTELLIDNDAFKELIRLEENEAYGFQYRLKSAIRDLERMLKHVEKELARLE